MRRGLNAENLADKRGAIGEKHRLEQKHKQEGYSSYYSKREQDVMSSLERIAETYSAKANLASKKYFDYEKKQYQPKTKTERAKRELDARLSKTKQYAQDYAETMRRLLQTPASQATDTISRMRYQKQIEDIRKRTEATRINENWMKSIRLQGRNIDQDLIQYYSGRTSILPEKAIKSKFWDPNFFEYDAD
jgi:hypothetical protein